MVPTIGNMILHASSPTPRHALNAHAYTAPGMRKCAQDIERGPTIMRFNLKWPCSDQILLTRLARALVHVMPPMKTYIEAKSLVGEIWVVSRLCCSIPIHRLTSFSHLPVRPLKILSSRPKIPQDRSSASVLPRLHCPSKGSFC